MNKVIRWRKTPDKKTYEVIAVVDGVGILVLRDNLNKDHAESLADSLESLRTTKLTICDHCDGIGGCYFCDS